MVHNYTQFLTGLRSWRTKRDGSNTPVRSATDFYSKPMALMAWLIMLGMLPAFSQTCTAPSGVGATLVTTTSANISWTAVEGSSGYEYAITATQVPPAEGTATTETSVSNIITTANATNYLHVRNNCSGTFSSWSSYSFFSGYCVPTRSYTGFNVNSFATTEGYTNITNNTVQNIAYTDNSASMSVSQSAGGSFSYSINVPSNTRVEFWVDWNNDLDFTDAGEQVASHTVYGSSATIYTGAITIPTGTANGTYRLRLRSRWYNEVISPCANYTYGGAQDYSLNVTDPPACMAPAGLTATMTSLTAATIGWSAVANAGNGYEYFISTLPTPPANGTVTTDSTVAGVAITPDTVNYLHVRANCGTDGYSTWVTTSFYGGYCLPTSTDAYYYNNIISFGTSAGYTNILNVPSQTTAYANYTAGPAVSQSAGESFSYSLVVAGYTLAEIWVDWNNDMVFDEVTERVAAHTTSGTANTTFTGTITIPEDTPLGSYRIRVRSRGSFYPTVNPCGNYTAGMAQDYNINVTTPPTCRAPEDATGTAVAANTANLSWTLPTTGAPSNGYEYAVTTSVTPPAQATGTTTETSVTGYTGIEDNIFYYLHVRANCGTEYSTWTTSPRFRYIPGDTCDIAISLDGATSPVSGTTVGATNNYTPSCNATGTGADIYYSVTVGNGYTLVIGQTVNDYDSVHSVFYGSCDAPIAINCTNDPDTAQLTWINNTGATQTVYWVQDGAGTGTTNAGSYTIAWTLTEPPVCNVPLALTAVLNNDSSVNVSWSLPTTSAPTGYEYAVTTSATPPETGTSTTELFVNDVVSTPNQYNYLHVRSNCGTDGYGEWVTLSFYSGHCIPVSSYLGYAIYGFSTTVGFTNIANTTAQTTAYVNNFDTMAVSQEQGGSFNYSAVVQSYSVLDVYVDWNNDLDFDDEGELIRSHTNIGTVNTTYTGTVQIPAIIAPGNYRMRLRTRGTSNVVSACTPNSNGMAQDYKIEITTTTPTCYVPINLRGAGVASQTVNLIWEAQNRGTAPVGYEYSVSTSAIPPASGTATTDTFVTGYTDILDNTYYYLHVRTNCGDGDYSQWSTSLPFRYFMADNCDSAVDLATQTSPYTHTTVGANADYNFSCAGGNTSPDLIYYIDVPNGYTLNIGQSSNDYDSENYVAYGNICPGENYINCFDDDLQQVEWENLTGNTQRVYWIQDGSYNQVNVGNFTLVWTLTPPALCDVPRELNVSLTSLTSANISWIAPNTGLPSGYEYAVSTSETAPESGTFTALLNAVDVAITANETNYLYVRSACEDENYSTWVSYSFYAGYCVPTNTNSQDYYISSITTTGADVNFTNESGFSEYTDYTEDFSVTTYPGASFAISATHPEGSYSYAVWIDWNGNFYFEDSERIFVTSLLSSPASLGSISVPLTVQLGTYRMRIRNSATAFPAITACGNMSNGEAEDYTINIVAAPSCFPPYAPSIEPIDNTTAELRWSPPVLGGLPQGYEYVFSTSATEPTGNGTATTTFFIGDAPYNAAQSHYLFVRTVCGDGDYSEWVSTSVLDINSPEILAKSIIVYKQDNIVNITSSNALIRDVTVYDIRGRKLYNESNINNSKAVINSMQLQQQVLIVEINTEKGKISKRIVY
ncbi:T9SS sorting signal type C domain-containing protein [Flavobacterium sp. Sd200]|uniref:GEVED domain-containing protein n=1 Tax=Flavobacterium sp. Sd200 TaxID=2692211 RepID=UPI001369A262|nr:GEVED domain-containing protein [Flavobacterium sp. Sd200]MXN90743.1 T9SS sorting signal type C domain-containing protein [Flavobacterium sp. Sd200]